MNYFVAVETGFIVYQFDINGVENLPKSEKYIYSNMNDFEKIQVKDPSGWNSETFVVYKDLFTALLRLDEIQTMISKGSYHLTQDGTTTEEKDLVTIFETCRFEPFKLRAKYRYQSDQSQISSRKDQRFSWNEDRLKKDPNYLAAKEAMNTCRFIWNPNIKWEDIQNIDNTISDWVKKIEQTKISDLLLLTPDEIMNLSDSEWIKLKTIPGEYLHKFSRKQISSIVDRLLDESAPKELLDKFVLMKKFQVGESHNLKYLKSFRDLY